MTTIKTVFVASMAMIVSACAIAAPIPVAFDTSVPAMVQADGLRAMLRVLPRSEVDRVLGDKAATQVGVIELSVENRGALPVSVERKWIRVVPPEGQDVYPLGPLAVANITAPGFPMISTGSNLFNAVQLMFGLATSAQNYNRAGKWDHLMPEKFDVAAGEERRILLVFPTPDWAPGIWRLELPFNTDTGAAGPQLSVPLTFKATPAAPDVPERSELGRIDEAVTLIRWEYIHPIEDEKLVTACRERMLKQLGQPLHSSEQTHVIAPTFKPALEEITQAFNAIKRQHAGTMEDRMLVNACVEGIAAGLEAPEVRLRSEFFNEEAFKELRGGGTLIGATGVEIGIDNGELKIVSTIEGGPADKTDLRRGDILDRIDDVPTKGLSLKEAVKLLHGRPGSTVRFTIIREGASKPVELGLTREIIRVQSVRSRWAAPAHAYIRISSFGATTVETLAAALRSFFPESDGELRGVILDLRDNSGGLLNACVGVASAFLPPSALVIETKGRSRDSSMQLHARPSNYARRGRPDHLKDLPGSIKSLPMVVMVNGKSAACSEIVAAALQDHKRATVVGTRTFGTGALHTIFPLTGDAALKLVTARYFRPSGEPIAPKGVTPDILVEETGQPLPRFDSADDPLLGQALRFLQSRRP